MSDTYSKQLFAGWGDMDFNSHMRNTAYLDKSGDVRMMFFAEHGFPMQEFMRLRIGPVVMSDEISYFKEVMLLAEIRATLQLAGISEDGSRFLMRNEFFLAGDKLAARVNSKIGWLDLSARRLCAPPPALLAALQSLPRSEDFTALPSSVSK